MDRPTSRAGRSRVCALTLALKARPAPVAVVAPSRFAATVGLAASLPTQALRRARLERRAASLSVLSGARRGGRGPLRVPWPLESSVRSSWLSLVREPSAIARRVSHPLETRPRVWGRRPFALQLTPSRAFAATATALPKRRPTRTNALRIAAPASIAASRKAANVHASPSRPSEHCVQGLRSS